MTDKWYSSFPMFPSAVMTPFVVVHGYQFNDTSFGVFIGALAIALFYSVLRLLSEHEGTARKEMENAALALILGFGTLFFYASIRGEVWFVLGDGRGVDVSVRAQRGARDYCSSQVSSGRWRC